MSKKHSVLVLFLITLRIKQKIMEFLLMLDRDNCKNFASISINNEYSAYGIVSRLGGSLSPSG